MQVAKATHGDKNAQIWLQAILIVHADEEETLPNI